MASKRQCEFFVLRYVPDVVKGEFVNIGVVLLETGESESAFTDVRLTRDWRRVRCLDPEVEVGLLQALEQDLRAILKSRTPEIINYQGPMSRREWLLKQIGTSWSGVLELTAASAVLTESPETELGVLAKAYLETPARVARERTTRGRQAIQGAMRGAFEEAGVLPLLLRDIAAAEFTRPGDPFKVDFGYQPNGVLHLLHAFSLADQPAAMQVNGARVLASSYADMREGIIAKRHVETDFTAIVEDGLDINDVAVAFALETLQQGGIQMERVAEMPSIAERVRAEMRL
jgi:hypothetical protein